MTTIIDNLIKQAEQEAEDAEVEQKRKQREFIEQVENGISDHLGELWPVLQPYIRLQMHDMRNGSARCIVKATDLELVPFYIHRQHSRTFLHRSEYASGYPPSDNGYIGTFLAECRQAFHESAKKEREKTIKAAQSQLRGYGARISEAAEAALASLLELDPDNAAEWHKIHTDWLDWYDRQQADKAQKEENKKQEQQAVEQYRSALEKYWAEAQRIDEHNKSAVDRLQAKYDAPFDIWKLDYAIVADDPEYGGREVDTRRVTVLNEKPDEDGFWTVYNYGLKQRKIYNPVSLEGPQQVRPTDGGNDVSENIVASNVCASIRLYYHPAEDRDKIKAELDTVLMPYPEKPEPPPILASYTIQDIERNIFGYPDGYDY
jgi:hypothetical protein